MNVVNHVTKMLLINIYKKFNCVYALITFVNFD